MPHTHGAGIALAPSHRAWKTFGAVLAVLIGAGTVAGVIGKAFYVTRDEYTMKEMDAAVEKTNVKNVLERLDHTMGAQQAAFEKLSGNVGGIKEDIAVIKARTSRRGQ